MSVHSSRSYWVETCSGISWEVHTAWMILCTDELQPHSTFCLLSPFSWLWSMYIFCLLATGIPERISYVKVMNLKQLWWKDPSDFYSQRDRTEFDTMNIWGFSMCCLIRCCIFWNFIHTLHWLQERHQTFTCPTALQSYELKRCIFPQALQQLLGYHATL